MKQQILSESHYLDNAATTKPFPEVLEEAFPYLGQHYGNPSSPHTLGLQAKEALKLSRERVARVLGVGQGSIVWTSGASESNNLALKGVMGQKKFLGKKLLISALEHPSVRETALDLQKKGCIVETIPLTSEGVVDLLALESMLSPEVKMLSCLAVSNELGTVQPLEEVGRLLRQKTQKAVFHVDATQGLAKFFFDWGKISADLVSFSGHKLHAPKGVGGLLRLKPFFLEPLISGGNQEEGLRSGTENLFGIVALSLALERAIQLFGEQRSWRLEYFENWKNFLQKDSRIEVFSSPHQGGFVLPFRLHGVPGEVLVHHLEEAGIQAGTGAACSSRKKKPKTFSYFLGGAFQEEKEMVRLSFSVYNCLEEQKSLFQLFEQVLQKIPSARSSVG